MKPSDLPLLDDNLHDSAKNMLAYDTFVESAIRRALFEVQDQLPKEATPYILDAGCGPGGVFPQFVEVFSDNVHIVGVDVSESHLDAAREMVKVHELGEHVTLQKADLDNDLPFEPSRFDVIWLSNVLTPGLFNDPVETLRRVSTLLRPGGIVAVFYGNLTRSTFLPGYPHLEGLVNSARILGLSSDTFHWRKYEGKNHKERAPTWLREAGFEAVSYDVLPIIYRRNQQELEPDAQAYLEWLIGKQWRKAVDEYGEKVGMDEEDRRRFLRLADPTEQEFILEQENYYCRMTNFLATGILK